MKIEIIEAGMIVKNYRVMCGLLDEPIKTGDSKKAQLKGWDRYFSYDKSGHSFIIKEVFKTPKEKESQERKGLYNDIVQILIMDLLAQNKGNIIITKEKLTKKIGLTNSNYSLGYNNQQKMSEYLDVDNVILSDFYKVNTSSISKIIDNSLASLERKFILNAQKVLMIQYNSDISPRLANEFDRSIVLAISKEALVSLGLKEIDVNGPRNANYYRFVDLRDKLIKQRTQIKYHYEALDIVINHEYINDEIEELTKEVMDQWEFRKRVDELNEIYSNGVIEKAENRHNKAIDEYNKTDIEQLTDILIARFSSIYVNTFHRMTDNLIKLDAPLIDKAAFFNKNNNGLSREKIDDINDNIPF